jgi:hypothetical protein
MDDRDQAFEARSRELFKETVDGLDARTRSRLTRARHLALQAATSSTGQSRARVWLPFAAAACALVLAVALWMGAPHRALSPASAEHPTALEDLDIVASNDELELFDDDVDFYRWVDAAPDTHEASVG